MTTFVIGGLLGVCYCLIRDVWALEARVHRLENRP
jgi:hypothetical protein